MNPRDKAILWIHETVGDNLDGEASLNECIEWIMLYGSNDDRSVMSMISILVLE